MYATAKPAAVVTLDRGDAVHGVTASRMLSATLSAGDALVTAWPHVGHTTRPATVTVRTHAEHQSASQVVPR